MRLVQNVFAQQARDCLLCQPAGKGRCSESIFKPLLLSLELLSCQVSELGNAAPSQPSLQSLHLCSCLVLLVDTEETKTICIHSKRKQYNTMAGGLKAQQLSYGVSTMEYIDSLPRSQLLL